MELFIQQGQLDTEVVVLLFFFIGDIVGNTTSFVNSGCDVISLFVLQSVNALEVFLSHCLTLLSYICFTPLV